MPPKRFIALTFLLALSSGGTYGCSCSRLGPAKCGGMDNGQAIFVGTVLDIDNPATERRDDQTGVSRYRFRIDEAISGVAEKEIDVLSGRGGGDCSYHFRAGQQYLVFPTGEATKLWATSCSDTRAVAFAGALLPQLRAMRDARKVASLYGLVYEIHRPSSSAGPEGDYQFLSNVKVRVRAKGKQFVAVTNAKGAYAFYDLPAGSYQYSAALPPHRVLGDFAGDQHPKPLVMPAGACYEDDLDVLPTGEVRGQVLDPDGKRLPCATIELFNAGDSAGSGQGLFEIQCEQDHFEFENISAGDYILVYNKDNRVDPDSPFARSFYPGTPDKSRATIIHLKDGERLLGTNIHVAAARPVREISVKFIAGSGNLPILNSVEARSDDGSQPTNKYVSTRSLRMFIFADQDYVLRGYGFCKWGGPIVYADSQKLSASDSARREIKFTFAGDPCEK